MVQDINKDTPLACKWLSHSCKDDREGMHCLLDNGTVTHRVDNRQPIGDEIEELK